MASSGYYASMLNIIEICAWVLIMCAQSLGWEHYEVHEPEPHILLFKSVILRIAPLDVSLTLF